MSRPRLGSFRITTSADKLPAKGAVLLGGLHFLAFLGVAATVLVLASIPVAQWQMTWLYFDRVDWPVSQLLRWEGWPRGPIPWLPYALSDPLWFFVPCVVIGVLGSLWYACLGALGGWVFQRARERTFRPSSHA
jgi:hypothetical protein